MNKKSLNLFAEKEVKNPIVIKGCADGKGTKETASRSRGKPELL